MKILLSSSTGYPSPDTGGPNKIIFYLLRELLRRKIDADYISKHFEFNKELDRSIEVNFTNKIRNKLFLNSALYRRAVTHPWYLNRHYNKLRDYFSLKETLILNYDCINYHDVLSGFHLRNFKKKKILTIHTGGSIINELDQAVKSNLKMKISLLQRIKQMEEAAFNEASYVTFPSIAAKNMFLEDLGKPETDKIKIIYNGIDFEEIEQISTSKEIFDKYGISRKHACYIFNAASHIKNKHIDKIILASELLLKKYHLDVCFINAGTGPLSLDLKKMVRRFGLGKNIYFLGVIPNKDVIRIMKICDFFIMASERVVFDMVILEALAAGTLVIATSDGGNKEIIKDGENGYLLRENEPEEIALKVTEADKSVVKGTKESIKLFSIGSMTEKYLDLYQKLSL